MAMSVACPVCASADIAFFCDIPHVPVHVGLLWQSLDAALACPKGDIRLMFCHQCGFIANSAFDPALLRYTQEYDNTLSCSSFFQGYIHALALQLIERYNLYGKDLIEIGCGSGDFLKILCELGNNRGVGFDPSLSSDHVSQGTEQQVTFIKDFFSEKYAQYHPDFICSRQVLEHIHEPMLFLDMLRRAIGNRFNTVIFCEVPNTFYILRDLSVWDIIYEHCSYFSHESLTNVFALSNFHVCNLTEIFEGQFLGIEARPSETRNEPGRLQVQTPGNLKHYVSAFPERFREKKEQWQVTLGQLAGSGGKAVLWGAGARGISFLNMLDIRDQIEFVVDINPHKEGKFMAGTGQQIVLPEFLKVYKPDVVILTNPVYRNEIHQMLNLLDIHPQLIDA